MPEDYIDIEELRRLMRSGGLNLAGQQTDPTYSSGFNYARSIAGGMPMEQVIAPGVSYSPEMAGGYTQKDLDMIAAGPAPVMPVAPTTGEVATIEDQMPYAPPGVQEPTRFMPFMQNLDFSGLPRYEDIRDIRSYEDIRPTLFDVDVEEILKDIDLINMDMPSIAPTMPQVPVQAPMNFTGLPQMPSMPIEPMVQPITAPVMPTKVLPQPIFANAPKPQPLPMPQVPVMPEPIVPAPRLAPVPQAPIQVPSLPSLPMNFTGLPQIPVMPEPIAPLPVIPQIPVMPQIAYTPPVPSFVQPQIEDIVSPIRAGSLRNFQQPGLFSLV